MAITVVTATIASGQSLSGAADCSAGRILRLATPDAWTTADISFQVADVVGGPYRNAYTLEGQQIAIPCRAGRCIIIETVEGTQFTGAFVKIRSGLAETPVVQAAERIFSVAIET
jgi:hypothetical protein